MDVTKLIGALRDLANAHRSGSIRKWQSDSVSGNKPADIPSSGHSGSLCEMSLMVSFTVSIAVNFTVSLTVNLTVGLTGSLTANPTELSFLTFCVLQQSVIQISTFSWLRFGLPLNDHRYNARGTRSLLRS